jgi:hypothetical protein
MKMVIATSITGTGVSAISYHALGMPIPPSGYAVNISRIHIAPTSGYTGLTVDDAYLYYNAVRTDYANVDFAGVSGREMLFGDSYWPTGGVTLALDAVAPDSEVATSFNLIVEYDFIKRTDVQLLTLGVQGRG